MISDRTANIVIGVVLAVWVCNVAAAILSIHGYESSEGINTIFTGTVGVAFAARAWAKDRGDRGDKDPKS